jgi:hypothetical protein
MMVGVVVCGLGLGISDEWRRAADCRRRATYYEQKEAGQLWTATFQAVSSNPKVREEAPFHRRRARYFGALRRKYDHAARYPWLPVAPDAKWDFWAKPDAREVDD